MKPAAIRQAFTAACLDELAACKPGNVHIYAAGHGMAVCDFRRAAEAAAPCISAEHARIGERVLSAVRASWQATGMNTNLGIVLLCAPLAQAALSHPDDIPVSAASLRAAASAALAGLDREDARLVFEAIALASPGGLGERAIHDVRHPPAISLRDAMALAAHEDRVAVAYCNDFKDIFMFGLASLAKARDAFDKDDMTVSALYLGFLGAFADSHIGRKFGHGIAAEVRDEACRVARDFYRLTETADRLNLLLAFDAVLKQRGLNPGTSADLTVATLFAERLLN